MIPSVDALKAILQEGKIPVIDIRLTRAFAEEHIVGTRSAPFNQTGWAEGLKPALSGSTIAIFSDSRQLGEAAKNAWERAGGTIALLWDQGLDPWKAKGEATVKVKNLTVDELAQSLDQVAVIDVREPYEWRSGIIPGAKTIPLGQLSQHLEELPQQKPYVVVCAHGNRSLAGASYLADRGYQAASVLGGMALWLGAGHPVDRSLNNENGGGSI